MNRRGPLAHVVAAVSANVLRVAGALGAVTVGGVVAASLGTERGLEVPRESAATATTTLDLPILVEFAAAHPAYPAAFLLALLLLALGDDVPLLGS